jgi:aryl carrier-like protein
VGAEDDFLDLGGDSLLATQLLAAVADRFGRELSVAEFFEEPTIAALARLIARADPEAAPGIERARGDADHTELSDDEVTALLTRLLAEEQDR